MFVTELRKFLGRYTLMGHSVAKIDTGFTGKGTFREIGSSKLG